MPKKAPSDDIVDLTGLDDEPASCPRRRAAARRRLPESDEDYDEGEASPSPPPKKKAKAAKKTPPPKRIDCFGRQVRYSAAPSIKIRERMARARPGTGHRMFLIDRKNAGPGAEDFIVLGATSNVYTVKISASPSCTCPDAAKGNVCKHHLFVMLRVLRRAESDPLVWQRGLLPDEVAAVLAGGAQAPDATALADATIKRRYKEAEEGVASPAGAAGGGGAAPRAITSEDECPICQEELLGSGASEHCFSCGNACHKQCIGMWTSTRRRQGLEATCPFCRGAWAAPGAGGAAAAAGASPASPYVNLGNGDGPSLEELYGEDRAGWIRYGGGGYGGGRGRRFY